ncbi:MAG TPA: DUF2127 domain-containing protein [Candidatus Methylacidiphilales bacterium]|jgi:uncharacterized membrane protein (DUF2068 family)|nr:DUF2127 domain-containing protein [Candidatus Methylacidiphilales bacterium]
MSAPTPRVAPWEDFVLRVIAVYKLLHALFFIGVGFGLLRLRGHNVVDFLNAHIIIPYHLNPENRVIYWLLDKADALTSHRLLLLGYAAFFYAALFAAEGIGLYLRKHWAEYLVVIVTGSLLPLEVYELFLKVTWWKYAAVIGNLLIVGYLIHRLLLDARFKAQQLRENEEKSSRPPDTARSKTVINEAS